MKEIAINTCYGDFGLSQKALKILNCDYGDYDNKRDAPELVKIIKELEEEANGNCAILKVVTIPDNIDWKIVEAHGKEWVAEKHRIWE